MTYDSFSETPLTGRLYEIVFSNYYFWLTLGVSVVGCLMPVIFYFKAKELLFPSLQDLIIQNVIDNKKVLEEADP